MIKTLTKDISITFYPNKDCRRVWRTNETFVASDYNVLKEYYHLKYPTVSVAARIDETDKEIFYQIILIFDEDADAAEFMKECANEI